MGFAGYFNIAVMLVLKVSVVAIVLILQVGGIKFTHRSWTKVSWFWILILPQIHLLISATVKHLAGSQVLF